MPPSILPSSHILLRVRPKLSGLQRERLPIRDSVPRSVQLFLREQHLGRVRTPLPESRRIRVVGQHNAEQIRPDPMHVFDSVHGLRVAQRSQGRFGFRRKFPVVSSAAHVLGGADPDHRSQRHQHPPVSVVSKSKQLPGEETPYGIGKHHPVASLQQRIDGSPGGFAPRVV